MAKHYTIIVEVNEVTEAVTDHRGVETQPKKVAKGSKVEVRAASKAEALEKLATIVPAL